MVDILSIASCNGFDTIGLINGFSSARTVIFILSNYDAVLEEALRTDYIDESEIAVLQEWRKDPANWNPETK